MAATTTSTDLQGLSPDFVDPVESLCVFTTLRWDNKLLESAQNTAVSCNQPNPIYLFEHHWTRLQVAKWGTSWYHEDNVPAKARTPASFFQVLNTAVQQWLRARDSHPQALRVKLRCYVGGKMSVEIVPINSLPLNRLFPQNLNGPLEAFGPTFTVFSDVGSSDISELTMYKTSQRDVYMKARVNARIASLAEPQEVLLFTADRLVYDGSISTPYFFRNGRWVTPAACCGGQQGVSRRWSLENDLAVEGLISIDSIQDGELMWLSNAVKGYYPGIFRRPKACSSD